MYTYICVCIYTYIHVCIYINIHIFVYTYVYLGTYIIAPLSFMCEIGYTCQLVIHTYKRMYMFIHTHVYILTHVYIYTHMHICELNLLYDVAILVNLLHTFSNNTLILDFICELARLDTKNCLLLQYWRNQRDICRFAVRMSSHISARLNLVFELK